MSKQTETNETWVPHRTVICLKWVLGLYARLNQGQDAVQSGRTSDGRTWRKTIK